MQTPSDTAQPGVSLTNRIYQHLWNEIAGLRLEPGAKLSESKLARAFECSRIPVREAVQRLAVDGALELRPQRGSYVTLIDLRQLEHVRYIREAVEHKIVMEGYREGCFASLVPYLEFLVGRQEELMQAASFEMAYQLDNEFHRVFYTATGKEFALHYTGEHDIHYARARLLGGQLERPYTVPFQHRIIVDAIRKNDETALDRAVSVHLGNLNHVFAGELGSWEKFLNRR